MGAIGVAASFALSGLVIRKPVLLWWAGRKGPVRTLEIYKAILPALVAAGTVAILLFLFRRATGFTNPFLGLVISFILAVLIAGATYFVLPAGRRTPGCLALVTSPLQEEGVSFDWRFPIGDCGLSSPLKYRISHITDCRLRIPDWPLIWAIGNRQSCNRQWFDFGLPSA